MPILETVEEAAGMRKEPLLLLYEKWHLPVKDAKMSNREYHDFLVDHRGGHVEEEAVDHEAVAAAAVEEEVVDTQHDEVEVDTWNQAGHFPVVGNVVEGHTCHEGHRNQEEEDRWGWEEDRYFHTVEAADCYCT